MIDHAQTGPSGLEIVQQKSQESGSGAGPGRWAVVSVGRLLQGKSMLGLTLEHVLRSAGACEEEFGVDGLGGQDVLAKDRAIRSSNLIRWAEDSED
ncbi:hypothetical protein J7T55_009572 [Diaporthe amygdali]|uniref:uncharacterized protein n=1 Tax=Phomopsis amygdali TaxID=1214568 RepID=UPI0022FEF496|nr:uncharacterized protein J7T55_009572 [Diaporthe amygdali]KAJ0109241.1 hypothetical protein J7T55_009572 [Diaporthe amygdali]